MLFRPGVHAFPPRRPCLSAPTLFPPPERMLRDVVTSDPGGVPRVRRNLEIVQYPNLREKSLWGLF